MVHLYCIHVFCTKLTYLIKKLKNLDGTYDTKLDFNYNIILNFS